MCYLFIYMQCIANMEIFLTFTTFYLYPAGHLVGPTLDQCFPSLSKHLHLLSVDLANTADIANRC